MLINRRSWMMHSHQKQLLSSSLWMINFLILEDISVSSVTMIDSYIHWRELHHFQSFVTIENWNGWAESTTRKNFLIISAKMYVNGIEERRFWSELHTMRIFPLINRMVLILFSSCHVKCETCTTPSVKTNLRLPRKVWYHIFAV